MDSSPEKRYRAAMSKPTGQPDAPPSTRAFVERSRGDLVSFDVGPPGLTSKHIKFAAFWGMMALMVLPLGVTGAILGIEADDWDLPIRVASIGFGVIGIVLAVGPLIWPFAHAWSWRERVQVSPGGALIRVGYPLRSRRWLVADSGTIRVENTPAGDKQTWRFSGGGGVILSWDDQTISIGAGLPNDARTLLKRRLSETIATASEKQSGPTIQEWQFPPLSGLFSWLREIGQLIIAPIRRPVSFLVCDVVTMGSIVLLPRTVGGDEWMYRYYPIIFVAFLAGLALRMFDRGYLTSLASLDRKYHWYPVAFVGAGLAVGLGGTLALLQSVPASVALTVPVVASVGVHVMLLKRSAKQQRKSESAPLFPVEALCTATLIPIAIVHEHASFLFFEDTARQYSILALPMVLPVVACVYLPVRIHFFITTPGDRSNRVWFGLTVVAMAIYAVFGVDPLGH